MQQLPANRRVVPYRCHMTRDIYFGDDETTGVCLGELSRGMFAGVFRQPLIDQG